MREKMKKTIRKINDVIIKIIFLKSILYILASIGSSAYFNIFAILNGCKEIPDWVLVENYITSIIMVCIGVMYMIYKNR